MDSNEHLKQLLDKLDAQEEATSEAATSDRLRQFRSDLEKQGLDESLILQAESMAFGFAENYPDETTGWGTYYGPMMVMKDEKGQWKEAPSIQLVTPEMIEYWARRSEEAKNPLFRARYADLVWDFSKKITGTSADVKYAQIRDTIKLRQTRPFVTKDQGYLIPKKSVFNRIIGDSHFELLFARFLEDCDDVISYTKNYLAVHFKLDYKNADGDISNYYPDFFVKLSDKRIFIVETKGQEDLDVPLKMHRLRQWCEDINRVQKEVKYDFVYVDEESFGKYKPTSFRDLVGSFTEYKEKV